jgi:hypothetical protein
MIINIPKISVEIQNVTRAFSPPATADIDSNGDIFYTSRELTAGEMAQIQAVIDAHDPIEYGITPSEGVIIADGVDTAKFVITSNPADKTAEMLVGNEVTVVTLDDAPGVGTLEVSTETPGIILVQGNAGGLAQCRAKVFAGGLS